MDGYFPRRFWIIGYKKTRNKKDQEIEQKKHTFSDFANFTLYFHRGQIVLFPMMTRLDWRGRKNKRTPRYMFWI